MTLTESQIPGLTLLHRGKVRETYAVGDDRLLLVATDRLSAFDVVFDQPIPDKGRLLTALSAFWFRELAALGPTHFLSTDADELPRRRQRARSSRDASRWRAARSGSTPSAWCAATWRDPAGPSTAPAARLAGIELPGGLREADRLPEPIFTPSTKAEVGHDENITREQLAEMVGAELAARARGAVAGPVSSGGRAGGRGGPDPGRHEVRVRLDRRAGGAHRRAADPGLVPLLGRGAVRAGRQPAVVRQAVRPRLRGRLGLESRAARALACRTR